MSAEVCVTSSREDLRSLSEQSCPIFMRLLLPLILPNFVPSQEHWWARQISLTKGSKIVPYMHWLNSSMPFCTQIWNFHFSIIRFYHAYPCFPHSIPEDQDWDLKNIFFQCLFIFERDRESVSEQVRDRERGRYRIWSRLQALSCQRKAQNRAWTHKPWDHDLNWSWTLNRLSHQATPKTVF